MKIPVLTRLFLLFILILVYFIAPGSLKAQPDSPESLSAYTLSGGSGKKYLLSSGIDSYWVGNTNEYNKTAYTGFTYRQQPVFKDFFIFVNGELLSRERAQVTASPGEFSRRFSSPDINEKLYLSDETRLLIAEFSADSNYSVTILPGFFSPTYESGIETEEAGGAFKITQNHFQTSSNLPLVSFIEVTGDGRWQLVDSSLVRQIDSDIRLIFPAQWTGQLENSLKLYFSISGDLSEHQAQVRSGIEITSLQERKSDALRSVIITKDPQVNQAIFWSNANLESLKMKQNGTGIFAGLPYHDYYYARDTFLALTGAYLVQGDYSAAKGAIRTFADHQNSEPADSNYGRIPDVIMTGGIHYQSADATPLFTSVVYEYLRYSGDFVLLREMFPVIKRGIEGTLRYHTDSNGLLVHEQSGTWMNKMGINGVWTPKGNRAVEIQALWYRQLQIGMLFADILGERETADRWMDAAAKLASTIQKLYWKENTGRLYDHLNKDNTPDLSRTPNPLLGAWFGQDLLSPDQRAGVLSNALSHNTYRWGVSTLSQEDSEFHTYYHTPAHASTNPSMHNGLVWPWLSGPLVDELMAFGRVEQATVLTENLTSRILQNALIGALPEVTNAVIKAPGSETTSVTAPSPHGDWIHAGGMAEYLRTWHQGYLGIQPDAFESLLLLSPRLPEKVQEASTSINFAGNPVDIAYTQTDSVLGISVRNFGNPFSMNFEIRNEDSVYTLRQPFQLGSVPDQVKLVFDYENNEYSLDNRSLPTSSDLAQHQSRMITTDEFVQPDIDGNLKALQSPDYRLLRPDDVVRADTSVRAIVDLPDPAGDDYGPGGEYVYPTHPFFPPGIFDITNFRVRSDEDHVYFEMDFRNLVQPGWHPEYGFQLTYAAIGIHTGDKENGRWEIGNNAKHRVDAEIPMQYIIYVGGGIRIESYTGEVIAEYRPDPGDPLLGNLRDRRISFSVPKDILPQPKRWWQYTVITGGQNDYGGGGIGEFREVKSEVESWYGGGKSEPEAPNWYDTSTFGY